MLTISLDGVMSDSTEHCELRMLSDPEALPHPREEVGETIVSAPDTLWNARTSACERKSTYAVWSKDDVWVCVG